MPSKTSLKVFALGLASFHGWLSKDIYLWKLKQPSTVIWNWFEERIPNLYKKIYFIKYIYFCILRLRMLLTSKTDFIFVSDLRQRFGVNDVWLLGWITKYYEGFFKENLLIYLF